MATWDEIQEGFEAGLDARREVFGQDFCDLIAPWFVEGGADGDAVEMEPLVTNVECLVKEISGASAQTVIGGEAFVSTHRIEMKKTAATLAITPEYRIKVLARGPFPERVFEKP